MTEPPPVEEYLGRLFDQLAGSGMAGRRLLVETEDHLRCAVADLEAAGHRREDAETLAVEQLGRPDRLAADLRASTVLPWSKGLARLLGGAWLLAAVALVSLGASAVPALAAAHLWGRSAIVDDPPGALYTPARCAYLLEYYPQPDGSCRDASVAHHYEEEIRNRLAAGIVGAVGLATFALARRGRRPWRRLRALTATPPSGVLAAVGATAFGVAALAWIGQGVDAFAIGRPWGAWSPIVNGLAALPAFAWCAWWALQAMRRPDVVHAQMAHA